MQKNFGRNVKKTSELTNSPGKFCKSFGITKELYGTGLTGNVIWIKDIGVQIDKTKIRTGKRVGINPKYQGANSKLRFWIPADEIV